MARSSKQLRENHAYAEEQGRGRGVDGRVETQGENRMKVRTGLLVPAGPKFNLVNV